MSLFSRFRAINDEGKAQVVRKLLENSTPDFDYFYMVVLSIAMATLGLLVDSPAVVIGSMLIAPVLFPLLSLSLGLVMSDHQVLTRSVYTLIKSLGFGLLLSVIVSLLFGFDAPMTGELLQRTNPSLLYLFVAVLAGLAASYSLAKPELNETLPGIAISVALIPPLAALGIGIATLNLTVISGSFVLLFINIIGIVGASMVTFSLMNLYEKRHIAKSTIEKEEVKMVEEKEVIEEIDAEEAQKAEELEEKVEKKGAENKNNKKAS